MSAAVCIALALGLLDRVCKHRALRRRGRFFELTHLENRGAAAGLLAAHPRWVLAFGCAVYALALALLLRVDGGACLRYGAALLACGGLSNLVDLAHLGVGGVALHHKALAVRGGSCGTSRTS